MEPTPIIVPATDADLPAIFAINQACVPHLGSLDRDGLRDLAGQACHFTVVKVEGKVAGFMLALAPGQHYASLNYRWFSDRYEDFVYVDRIAFASDFRGAGLGRKLYEDLEHEYKGRAPVITCEVNLLPPNPESLAFHRRLGFEEVGQQETEGGKKRVSLLAKAI